MPDGKRQFDRNKYLNSPHELTPEQVGRLEIARRRELRMRPVEFWLRGALSLASTIVLGAAVSWLADW